MEYYKKTLTFTEVYNHFVYITVPSRKFFPPLGEVFSLLINENEFRVYIDKYGRIRGSSFKGFIDFKPWSIFIFTKINKNKFRLVRAHYQP